MESKPVSRRLSSVAIVFSLLSSSPDPAGAVLGPVNLEDFSTSAGCVAEGLVRSVTLLREEEAVGDLPFRFDSAARLEIREIWRSKDCVGLLDTHGSITILFSQEVHSSQPRTGDVVVIALRREGEHWFEAVYGRSYWQIIPTAQAKEIVINWRNDFLLQGKVKTDSQVTRPYSDIRNLLQETWDSQVESESTQERPAQPPRSPA